MSAQTRRRVFVCLVVFALTLPAETILLRAWATPSVKDAARAWVAGLSVEELDRVADNVEGYPVAYRRQIMQALTPEHRADVWRAHIKRYIFAHPELDGSTVIVLESAAALAGDPATFGEPTTNARAAADAVATQLSTLIGKEDTANLLSRLGPRDGTFASLVPLPERLANWVRQTFTTLANQENCECNTSFGCDGPSYCRAGTGCSVDNNWPMCGWFWDQPCDGLCYGGAN